MAQWSEGIYLLGQYNPLQTGCWLLTSGQQGAILELPPYSRNQVSPVITARQMAKQLGIQITYLLCSHDHGDHFALATLWEFTHAFPQATVWLQAGFRRSISGGSTIQYFDSVMQLKVDGEPLFLVHAPKHSWTDTMVIFRGVAFTGDWELNTIRSVNNSVPTERKLQSIETMTRFPEQYNYRIHKVFSVHANDRREDVDFPALMQDTRVDRKLW